MQNMATTLKAEISSDHKNIERNNRSYLSTSVQVRPENSPRKRAVSLSQDKQHQEAINSDNSFSNICI